MKKVQSQFTDEQVRKMISNLAKKKHLQTIRQHYGPLNLMKPLTTHKNEEIDGMDIDDFLKTTSHQKKKLNKEKWKLLQEIHQNSQLQQTSFKYFLLVSSEANYRKLDNPGYYDQLKEHKGDYPKEFFITIEKDIPRTLSSKHPLQQSLRNVLSGFAIHNPGLLYCQGMNYIVYFLLINGFNQEQAFWMMATLIQDIVMPDYFKDLSTISISFQIFNFMLEDLFPELAVAMKEIQMDSTLFMTSWYVCLFTKGFINTVSQYLLEEIIIESRHHSLIFIMIKISLGIITTMFLGSNFQYDLNFTSLKEVFQEKAQQISLQDVKKGMNYFQFDIQTFSTVEKHFRRKKDQEYRLQVQEKYRKQEKQPEIVQEQPKEEKNHQDSKIVDQIGTMFKKAMKGFKFFNFHKEH